MATTTRPPAHAGVLAMRPDLPAQLFGEDGLDRLSGLLGIDPGACILDFDAVDDAELAQVEVLVTGWGCPVLTERILDRMPRLRAIIHAAGTVKGHLAADAWRRGIRVTSAAAANALPVAEYALAMILLAGKDVLATERRYAADPEAVFADTNRPEIGNNRRTVGVVGASRIGRRVIELLEPFDLEVLLYDPHLDADDPVVAHARPVGLDDLMRRSSIVTVHAPLLPETVGMIGAPQLALLAPGSTVINTARAPIVDQAALAEAVRERGIKAVLDVTDPEPLPAAHPLRGEPEVLITPHVAGALGNELRRLGDSAIQEIELLLAGRPAAFPITKEALAAIA